MTSALPRVLDRRVEHDPRNRQAEFRAAQAPLRTVTHRAPGTKGHGPILNQGNVGGCTFWSLTHTLNSSPLLPPKRRLLTDKDAYDGYVLTTRIDEFPGQMPEEDTGSSGPSACKAAKQLGYISAYHHAFGIDQALGALPLAPVITGVSWKDSMWNPDKRGYLDISGKTVGGHEVAVIGINTTLRRVTILNQWYNEDGKPWGLNGRAYLTWDDWAALLGDQGDVTVPVR